MKNEFRITKRTKVIFYRRNNYAVFNKVAKLRIPSGQKQKYKIDEDGIYSSVETYDQDGEYMYAEDRMIISKEAFIEAHKRYIEG